MPTSSIGWSRKFVGTQADDARRQSGDEDRPPPGTFLQKLDEFSTVRGCNSIRSENRLMEP